MKKIDNNKNLISNQSHTPSFISKTWSKVASLTNKITDIGSIIKKPQDSGIVYILWDKSSSVFSEDAQSKAARQAYIMSADSIEKGYEVGIIVFDYSAYEIVKPTKDLHYIGEKVAVIENTPLIQETFPGNNRFYLHNGTCIYIHNSNIFSAITYACYVFLKKKTSSNIMVTATDWEDFEGNLFLDKYMTRERFGEMFKVIRGDERYRYIVNNLILRDNNAIDFLAENCYKLLDNTTFISVSIGERKGYPPPLFIDSRDFEAASELILSLPNTAGGVNNTRLLARQR